MLLIKRIVLVGKEKKYIVSFEEGLNIIYGDSDKGKTTILELIKYALGSEKFKINLEIEEKVERFFFEVEIKNKFYTIERDLFDKNNYVKVYKEKSEEILENKEVEIKYFDLERDGKFQNYSDFLLEKMGIPQGRISKKKNGKIEFQNITLPSIMKFCYLTQDDIGSKKMLNLDNYGLFGMNMKVLKYIYKVLDEEIAQLEGEIGEVLGNRNLKEKEYEIIKKFLSEDETLCIGNLNKEIEETNQIILETENELKNINSEILEKTNVMEKFRKNLNENYMKETELTIEIEKLKKQNIKFEGLLKKYIEEIEKIELGINLLNRTNIDLNNLECLCPVCKGQITLEEIEENYEIEKEEFLKLEKKRVKLKHVSLMKYIDEVSLQITKLTKEKIELNLDIKNSEKLLNKEVENCIAPFISIRDSLNENIGRSKERINEYYKLKKIEEKIEIRKKEVRDLDNFLSKLNNDLEDKRENSISTDEMKEGLALNLNQILTNIEIENLHNVGINKRFLPIFRGDNYEEHTSGGVRTILSVSYYLSILEDTINKKLNKPSILLIDTIGNFLGKNKEKNDNDEVVNDPKKYHNMYHEILRICELGINKNKKVQVIVVDNDYPGKKFEIYMRKKFGKEENYECGLINDYK